MESPRAVVLVPVKPLARAKSRLRGRLGARTDALVLAMALDTIAAACHSPLVDRTLVLTEDAAMARACRTMAAALRPRGPVDGLNAALRDAAEPLAGSWVVIAQPADCPSVTSDDFTDLVLAASATPGRVFVADAAGSGTTSLAAAPGVRLDPRYGPQSRMRHTAAGAVELPGPHWARMRQDVDVWSDLGHALALGVGMHTQRWLDDYEE